MVEDHLKLGQSFAAACILGEFVCRRLQPAEQLQRAALVADVLAYPVGDLHTFDSGCDQS